MAKVGIIGAGSWGTALSLLLHKNGNQVTVWSALEDEIAMLLAEHEQKDKLPGVKLPEDMIFTTDLEEAVKDSEVLILAVPSPFTRSTAERMSPYMKEGQIIVNVAKGIEEKTLMRFPRRKWPCCPGLPMRRRSEEGFPQPLWWEPGGRRLRRGCRICL